MFNTILFPLDRSREAQEAIAVVVDLVQKYDSKLILLSVMETPNLDAEIIEETVMQSPEAIQSLLVEGQELFAKRGIAAEVMQCEGNPPFVICDVADELNVNLIVMGSRGIGLDAERTTESVANRVINLSPCPVLIVP
jgi:nucleotide-binding universal stress UspA family protein